MGSTDVIVVRWLLKESRCFKFKASAPRKKDDLWIIEVRTMAI